MNAALFVREDQMRNQDNVKTSQAALGPDLQDGLNEQINKEISSAYIYLSMSAYFDSIDLKGFAHWTRVQYHEEIEHALKLFDFIGDRRGRVQLKAISQPPTQYASPLQV